MIKLARNVKPIVLVDDLRVARKRRRGRKLKTPRLQRLKMHTILDEYSPTIRGTTLDSKRYLARRRCRMPANRHADQRCELIGGR